VIGFFQGRWQKNFQRGWSNGKKTENRKKDQKLALLSLFQGRGGGGGQRTKTPKNSTFKPLSTIFVPFIKIQELGATPSSPRCRRP